MAFTFPGGFKKAFTLSYDDGMEQDKRLLEILNKYGLKCTFNLNSEGYGPEGVIYEPGTIHRRMSRSEAISVYKNSGHEVAFHGAKHLAWTNLEGEERDAEVAADIKQLEDQYGCQVLGGAYPYGAYDEKTVEYLRSIGAKYCRTVVSTEGFELPAEPLTLNPTCHHNDPKLFELARQFLEYDGDEPLLFYVWGHTYEFDEKNNWELIEKFAQLISGHDDVWYATNIEIIDSLTHVCPAQE